MSEPNLLVNCSSTFHFWSQKVLLMFSSRGIMVCFLRVPVHFSYTISKCRLMCSFNTMQLYSLIVVVFKWSVVFPLVMMKYLYQYFWKPISPFCFFFVLTVFCCSTTSTIIIVFWLFLLEPLNAPCQCWT